MPFEEVKLSGFLEGGLVFGVKSGGDLKVDRQGWFIKGDCGSRRKRANLRQDCLKLGVGSKCERMQLDRSSIGEAEVRVEVGGQKPRSTWNKSLPETRVSVLESKLFIGECGLVLPTTNVCFPSEGKSGVLLGKEKGLVVHNVNSFSVVGDKDRRKGPRAVLFEVGR